jgi:hypothetical protein
MNTSTKIGVAVVGGYVLGRRKKAKMALLLGSVLLGKRVNLRSLGKEAMERVAGSAEFGQIREEVRGELVSTGRAAAGAVVSAPLNKLADGLHQRTMRLTGEASDESSPDGRSKRSKDEDGGEDRAEGEGDEGDRAEGEGDEGDRAEGEGDEGDRAEGEGDEGDRAEREGDEGERGGKGEEREEERQRRRRPPTRPSRPTTRSAADRMSRTRPQTPAGAGSRRDRD